MARTRRPSPALVFNVVVSGGLLAVISLWARRRPPGRWERDLFALINEIPGPVTPLLVLVMQLGSYPAVFVAAAGAAGARRIRLARDLLVAGNVAYWLAAAAKIAVGRRRPAAFLPDVRFHDVVTGGFGYPSGHVAVAAALGVVLAPAVPRHRRGLVWLAVGLVCVARVRVGAHLPVDVLVGLLVGWLAASLTRLAMGDIGSPESVGRIRQVLGRKGIDVARLEPMAGDGRGSHPWRATTSDGRRLFVKATGGRQRDADWLYRLYRRLRYLGVEDEPPYVTARQKTEHEAYLTLLAERAGVRTPRFVATAADPAADALLVQEFVDGRPLDALGTDGLGAAALADVCRQVALLHRAGLAHRDLRAANVLVHDSSAYLVGFGSGTDDATPDQRARDLVELLTTLAYLAGVRPAVAEAVRQLGVGPVADSLPYLQPALLSRAGRRLAHDRPGLLDEIRDEIHRRCPEHEEKLARVVRISRRDIFLLVMLGLLVHFLLPQIGQVRTALREVLQADPLAVSGVLLASAATYLLSALALRLAAGDRIPLGVTVVVQLAAAFANRIAPGAVGGAALSLRYLRQQGLPLPVAATAVAATRVAGVLSVGLLLPVLLPFARRPTGHVTGAATDKALTILFVVLAVLLLAAAVLALPRLRGRLRAARRQVIDAVRSLAGSGRISRLLAACLGLTLAYGVCLYLALLAVGLSTDPLLIPPVVLVCIVGEGVASAAPTPGGLGATEAALVSGLLLYGVPAETAVAGVLIYRLATFWLPSLPGYVALRILVRRRLV
jgi:uncharacterized membrane protein YbhN (UPF0104 family)/membrane-associated phospholipid phosphatase